ncbi:MAG: YceI family protein [Desulfobulbaceae bacterium]|nr:YceI family protein [Candidatus Kapabacteria bacterium]MBS4000887.1 YceI family protein [Desulfobulbaceae bacterium]
MFKQSAIIIIIGAFLMLTATAMQAQKYTIDAKSSTIKWIGEKVIGKHWGTIKLQEGHLMRNDNQTRGEFRIDMTTIKIDDLKDAGTNAKLLGHLKSDDFFNVDNFKTATFILDKITPYNPKPGENYNYWVSGKLTIKGITNEIRFPAQIDFSETSFTSNAEFTIDRTKWNVKYNSGSLFSGLGDSMIYDDIKFELVLKGFAN